MDNWYNMDREAVLKEQKSDAQLGLSTGEAQKRQTEFGLNKFAEKKKESLFSQIMRQLKDVAVVILLLAAVLSFARNVSSSVATESMLASNAISLLRYSWPC